MNWILQKVVVEVCTGSSITLGPYLVRDFSNGPGRAGKCKAIFPTGRADKWKAIFSTDRAGPAIERWFFRRAGPKKSARADL